MKRKFKTFAAMVAISALAGVLTYALAGGESKFIAGTTSAGSALVFGPEPSGQTTVTAYSATSDKGAAVLKFYACNGNRLRVTSTPTSTTVIPVANSSYALTNSDLVVYVSGSGEAVYRTISSATTTSATLNAAVTTTKTATDAIYELGQVYQIAVAAASVSGSGDALVVTRADSPLYAVVDAGTNSLLSITVSK
jgi:hypothetical protein